jgi:hypothetical protein
VSFNGKNKLRILYSTVNFARMVTCKMLGLFGDVARMRKTRSEYKILTRKPLGTRPIGR